MYTKKDQEVGSKIIYSQMILSFKNFTIVKEECAKQN